MSVQILFGENKLLGQYTDADIVSCDAETSVTVIGDTVSIDQFHAEVIGQPHAATGSQQQPIEIDGLTYGVPIWFYINEGLYGKFYFSSAERISATHYNLTAVSAMGLLEAVDCVGGIYYDDTVSEIASDIIGNTLPYTVESQAASVPVRGWIPYTTKKDALHQLMIAVGADVKKDSNGDMLICFNNGNESTTIPASRTFTDGTILRNSQATEVDVTEHSFVANASDAVVTLYDNTNGEAAYNSLVVFSSAPVHDLAVTGTLVIESSGCNHAIVTGNGKLTGKVYTHTTKVTKAVDPTATGSSNVATVDAGTLISELNSGNVAQRLLAYYKSAETITADIIVDGEKSGDKVEITNPFGELSSAYIKSMDIMGSGIVSAKCEFITGYTPCFQGNTYHEAVILTGSGTYTVPAGKYYLTAILIGGGQGGQGGGRGGNGSQATETTVWGYNMREGAGGAGGAGGQGGQGGKIFQRVVAVQPGDTISFACGSGGAGGSGNGGQGSAGTHTTFGTLDSDNGSSAVDGIVNRYSGIAYGAKGIVGVAGGAGGSGGHAEKTMWNTGATGGAVGTNTGGAGGTGTYESTSQYVRLSIGGAGGGGAANGANGGNATNTSIQLSRYLKPGNGGDGASATIPGAAATVYGQGGQGGSGGGGGGGWGGAYWLTDGEYDTYGQRVGQGGNGSAGGAGAAGCIILYI